MGPHFKIVIDKSMGFRRFYMLCENKPRVASLCKAREKEVSVTGLPGMSHMCSRDGLTSGSHTLPCVLSCGVQAESQESALLCAISAFRNILGNNKFHSFLHNFHNFFTTSFLPVCICHYG